MTDKRLVTIFILLGVIVVSFIASLIYVNVSVTMSSDRISSVSRNQLFVYSEPDKSRGPGYETRGEYLYLGSIHVKNNGILSTTYKVENDWVACAYDKETKTSRDLQFALSSGEPTVYQGMDMNRLYYDLKGGEEMDITMRVSPYHYYDKNEDVLRYDQLLLVPRQSQYVYAPDICSSVSDATLQKAISIPLTD